MPAELTILTWTNEKLAKCLKVNDELLLNLVNQNLISITRVNSLRTKYNDDIHCQQFAQKLLIELDRNVEGSRRLHIFLQKFEQYEAAEVLYSSKALDHNQMKAVKLMKDESDCDEDSEVELEAAHLVTSPEYSRKEEEETISYKQDSLAPKTCLRTRLTKILALICIFTAILISGIVVFQPRPCVWSEWTSWTPCSVTCSQGQRFRNRTVLKMERYGGKSCSLSQPMETSACDLGPCPVPCTWTQWSSWSSCSVTCGKGSISRNRIVKQKEMFGGTPCNIASDSIDGSMCVANPCISIRNDKNSAKNKSTEIILDDMKTNVLEGLDLLELALDEEKCTYKNLEKWLPAILTYFATIEDEEIEDEMFLNFLATILKHLRATERYMKQYSWDNNQDIILLGLRNAGQYMMENARHQEFLSPEESDKMENFGSLVHLKFDKCQETHLSEFYNVLFDIK